MRFHGLMLVRDEADIIAENLTHTLRWADSVTIFDTGSTDGTWDIIQAMAESDSRINTFESSPVVYGNHLRAYVFDRVRALFDEGDWVVKLDADEFFYVPPPKFVAEHMRTRETCVWLQWYFFRLTSQEVTDYESGRVSIAADRTRPIGERRRFYKIPRHSEPRMFRYRKMMKWPDNTAFPHHAGFLARERIPILHYPHRDPEQMAARYRLRAMMKQLRSPAGPHWQSDNWRNDVIECNGGLSDAHERRCAGAGLAAVDDHTSGPLLHWEAGTELPKVHYSNHLKPHPVRTIRYMLNTFLLPVFDRTKPSFSPMWRPKLIESKSSEVSRMAVHTSSGRPGFHGLLLVRDEADIIGQTMNHLLEWADSISVLDLGSVDETWDIVQAAARQDHRVIPVEKSSYVFSNSVRGYLFDRCRGRFRNGDWIIRMDGDEIYHVTPPEFVRQSVCPHENLVHLNWYYFRLTAREVKDYETGQVDVFKDRLRPIEQRRRFYKIPDYSEPRMFRYRSTIKWSPTGSFPYNAGPAAKACIPIRHYPHRDPIQMEVRYKLRAAMMRLKDTVDFPQWAVEDWRTDVMVWDNTTNKWAEPGQLAGGLRAAGGHAHGELVEWKPGEELPPISVQGTPPVYPAWRRLLLRKPMIYLPDMARPGWPSGLRPTPMPTGQRSPALPVN